MDYDYYAAYCNGRHYRAFLQPLMGGNPDVYKRQGNNMAKLHLVMPMAGRGSRFFENGFVMPKPLIEICLLYTSECRGGTAVQPAGNIVPPAVVRDIGRTSGVAVIACPLYTSRCV